MYIPVNKHNSTLWEQVIRYSSSTFTGEILKSIRNILFDKNTCMIFYWYSTKIERQYFTRQLEQWYTSSLINISVLIIYVCTEINVSKLIRTKKNKIYDNISGICITYVLMNLLLWHGFSRDDNSTIILTCRINMFSHELSKGFVMIELRNN